MKENNSKTKNRFTYHDIVSESFNLVDQKHHGFTYHGYHD